jgi:hypothetical protein
MTSRQAVAMVVAAAFAAFLLYGTLAGQKVECSVVMEFDGRQDSAAASAASEAEAEQQARTTACATISSGMNDRIACAARPPVTRECRPA